MSQQLQQRYRLGGGPNTAGAAPITSQRVRSATSERMNLSFHEAMVVAPLYSIRARIEDNTVLVGPCQVEDMQDRDSREFHLSINLATRVLKCTRTSVNLASQQ